jgi:hypothetical protein
MRRRILLIDDDELLAAPLATYFARFEFDLAGALRYGAGDFSQPIKPRRNDELGDLAAQINRMADGLHGMLDAKRQLLLAISHELRSPLTRARLNAELVDDSPARDALLHDLSEMRDLITDLLESERLAAGHAALHTGPTDLNALVRELLDGPFKGRAVTTALDDTLPSAATLDATRIRLLLRNLLDNALRHSSDAAMAPHVATSREEDGTLLVTIRDHGPRQRGRTGAPHRTVLSHRQRTRPQHRRRRPRPASQFIDRASARRAACAAQRQPRPGGNAELAPETGRYFFPLTLSQSRKAASVFSTCLLGFRLW